MRQLPEVDPSHLVAAHQRCHAFTWSTCERLAAFSIASPILSYPVGLSCHVMSWAAGFFVCKLKKLSNAEKNLNKEEEEEEEDGADVAEAPAGAAGPGSGKGKGKGKGAEEEPKAYIPVSKPKAHPKGDARVPAAKPKERK